MKTSSLFLIAGMLFLMACTNEKGSDKSKENNTSTTIEASPPKSMSQSKILIDTVSTITELDTIVPTTLVIDSIPDSILARRAAFLRYSIDPSQIWLSFPFDMNRDDPWDTRVSGNTVSFNEWGFEYLDSCIFVYLEPYSRSKMEYPQVVDTFRLEAEADSYEEDLYGEESMLFRKVKNPHFVICGLKAKEGYVPGLKPTPSDFGHPKYLGDTISIRLNNQTYYIFTEAEQRDTFIDGKK